MSKARRARIEIMRYSVGPLLDHDPAAPLPAHVEKYRTRREAPDVPVMCANIYCRTWVFGGTCKRCGRAVNSMR